VNLQLHTREFAAATTRPSGAEGMLEAARALALTVLELARSEAARAEVAAASGVSRAQRGEAERSP
jgi:hypothetical protein